jgi:hypothetical protein
MFGFKSKQAGVGVLDKVAGLMSGVMFQTGKYKSGMNRKG